MQRRTRIWYRFMVVEPKGNTGSGRTGQQQHNVTLELQSHVNHQADRWAKNTCENGSKSYSSFEIAFSHTCRITAPNLASNDTHNWIAKRILHIKTNCFVQTVLIIDIIQIVFIKTISGTYWLDVEQKYEDDIELTKKHLKGQQMGCGRSWLWYGSISQFPLMIILPHCEYFAWLVLDHVHVTTG